MTENQIVQQASSISLAKDYSATSCLFDTARFEHMFRIAQAMAQATLIPEHLWKDKQGPLPFEQVAGNCFLIVNQAVRWGMDPFAVAPETYSARGKLGFQGKLVAAVINTRAGLKERLDYSFTGSGDALTVTVSGAFQDEGKVRTVTLSVKDAKTDNDIWRKDPEQKLIYSGAIKWARRHCPEIILGVLTDDDVERIAIERQAPDLETQAGRALDLYHRDCKATEEYNAKLKAQGIPEDQWEPMPPMPGASEQEDATEVEAEIEEAKQPKEEIPWREVVAISQFKTIAGKKLGDLPLSVLEKIREAIIRQSATVRASKPGTVELLAAVCKGIKELTPVPPKATPLEGLRNLIDRSGVTDEAVLKMAAETFDITPKALEDLSEEHIKVIRDSWADAVGKLKQLSQ